MRGWENVLLILAGLVVFAIRLYPLGKSVERVVGRGLVTRSEAWTAEAWWADLHRGAPDRLGGLWFGLVELGPGRWHIYVASTATFDAETPLAGGEPVPLPGGR